MTEYTAVELDLTINPPGMNQPSTAMAAGVDRREENLRELGDLINDACHLSAGAHSASNTSTPINTRIIGACNFIFKKFSFNSLQ